MCKPGRPMKYKFLLAPLNDNRIYCPAAIVLEAMENGLWRPLNNGESLQRQKLRLRHSLARFSRNHDFPYEGDGLYIMKGQAPQRGWYGWRWKAACGL